MRIAAIGVTCSALLVVIGLQAQTPQTFEVASIRRNLTGNPQGGGVAGPEPGGRTHRARATHQKGVVV